MSSQKKSKKNKKGREPSEPSCVIDDGNLWSPNSIRNLDSQTEIEIIKKENEVFKKENEILQKENQILKNENEEMLSKNEQLKQELKKLKEMTEKNGNVDNIISQNNVSNVGWNEDPECEEDNASGYTGNVTARAQGQIQDTTSREKGKWKSQNRCDRQCIFNATHDTGNAGYNGRRDREDKYANEDRQYDEPELRQHNRCEGGQFGNRRTHGQEFRQHNRYEGEQLGNRRQHGREFRQHDRFEGGNVGNGQRRIEDGPGYRHGYHVDQGRRNNNTRREGNYEKYDKNREPFSKVQFFEINGDLFTAPEDHSLAHCVAVDLRMGSGIAVQFKQQFKNVDELLGQRKKVGQVAVLENKGRYIYYLITKKLSTGKPRLSDLEDSLEDMRKHVVKNEVKKIAIPRLGCGLDRLNWRDVRSLLLKIFADVDVTITVYNFTIEMQNTSDHPPQKSTLYISNHLMRLVNIEKDTLLVLFGTECGFVDKTMEELDEKFRFINDYRVKPKILGEVLELEKCKEILCILIVKKRKNDLISYPALKECFMNLRKIFKKHKYEYMGFSAFEDGGDELTVAKIVTLLKVVFSHVICKTWICWPDEMKNTYEEFTPGISSYTGEG